MSTRERILDAATRRIAIDGYEGFTVAAVRDELGLSSGSMFHAFPSKAALGAAVYVRAMVDYQAAAVAAITSVEDAGASLDALVDTHLRWVEGDPGSTRFLFSTLADDVAEHAVPQLVEHNERFFATLDGFYDRLRATGLMGDLDRAVAHAVALGPTQEYCRQWVRGRCETPPSRLADLLTRTARAALAATAS